jgi:hypothetical protein
MVLFQNGVGSCALPPRWPPQCSCVVIESSFDPGERLQAPGSLWLVKLFVWALILRKLKKAKLTILRFQLYLKGVDLGYPKFFPSFNLFLICIME